MSPHIRNQVNCIFYWTILIFEILCKPEFVLLNRCGRTKGSRCQKYACCMLISAIYLTKEKINNFFFRLLLPNALKLVMVSTCLFEVKSKEEKLCMFNRWTWYIRETNLHKQIDYTFRIFIVSVTLILQLTESYGFFSSFCVERFSCFNYV